MIQINTFRLTPKIYFNIIARQQFLKSWWLYSSCLLCSMYFLLTNDGSPFSIFMIVFGIIYYPIVLTYYYFFATSSKNSTLFLDRQLTLENNKLSMTSDGIYSELHYKHIQKIVETTEYLLLYIAKSQFVYIPKTAFVNPQDIEEFKKMIKNEA